MVITELTILLKRYNKIFGHIYIHELFCDLLFILHYFVQGRYLRDHKFKRFVTIKYK